MHNRITIDADKVNVDWFTIADLQITFFERMSTSTKALCKMTNILNSQLHKEALEICQDRSLPPITSPLLDWTD